MVDALGKGQEPGWERGAVCVLHLRGPRAPFAFPLVLTEDTAELLTWWEQACQSSFHLVLLQLKAVTAYYQ